MILDLSQWQRPALIDYARIASQVDGVILRIGYGLSPDTAFERHYQEFTKRGVKVGAYHFPIDERKYLDQVTLVKNAVAGKVLLLGIWADVEHPMFPKKLSKATVDAYLPMLDSALKVKVGVYTSYYKWREIMADSTAHNHRPLWIANYGVSKPNLPPAWRDWALWQYTDKGRLDGYSGSLDMDNRNVAVAIQAYPASIVPPPPPESPLYQARVTADVLIVRNAPRKAPETDTGKRLYGGNEVNVYEEVVR